MGTRTIIEFRRGRDKIQVYQHWDGYPSYVIKELEEFIKWNGSRCNDLSYTVANFVTWNKVKNILYHINEHGKEIKNVPWTMQQAFDKADHNDNLHTGFGIIARKYQPKKMSESCWAEYYYKVNLDNLMINAYSCSHGSIHHIGECMLSVTSGVISMDEGLKEAVTKD